MVTRHASDACMVSVLKRRSPGGAVLHEPRHARRRSALDGSRCAARRMVMRTAINPTLTPRQINDAVHPPSRLQLVGPSVLPITGFMEHLAVQPEIVLSGNALRWLTEIHHAPGYLVGKEILRTAAFEVGAKVGLMGCANSRSSNCSDASSLSRLRLITFMSSSESGKRRCLSSRLGTTDENGLNLNLPS